MEFSFARSRTASRMVCPASAGRVVVLVVLILGATSSAWAGDQQPEAYKVGPEDTIKVSVARHPEFSGEFYVPTDGVVNLPGVGETPVSGKTLTEISEAVTERLSERLREPEVTVTLEKPRMQRIYVLGEVTNSGPYDMKPGWRITEAIAAAGGLASGIEASDCSVTILRASTGARERLDLAEVMRGTGASNAALESGDVVTVEACETFPVYVMGRVKAPGLYRMRKDGAGVIKALALAGGTLEDAAMSRVTVTHLSGSSETVNLAPAMLEGGQEPAADLQPGDLVVVPEQTSRIAVLGYVNQPDFYPLKDGQKMTLSEALALARGVDNKRGELSAVAVIRTQGSEQQKLVFDLQKFLKSGDLTQNPEVRAGDVIYVPETKKPDWQVVFSALSSIGLLLNPLW